MTDKLVERRYLLVKRGLYYRPENAGYTAIKAEAGRYLQSDAIDGVNYAVHEDEAAQFSPSAWEATKIAHLSNRIEAQAAEIEELKSWKAAEDAHHHMLRAENERLREAGNDLGFYAGHEDACDCVRGWARGPCNCGYTEAWQAWHSLAGKAEQ
jgi:hypothetical protein